MRPGRQVGAASATSGARLGEMPQGYLGGAKVRDQREA